jgi:hypothetical protein
MKYKKAAQSRTNKCKIQTEEVIKNRRLIIVISSKQTCENQGENGVLFSVL